MMVPHPDHVVIATFHTDNQTVDSPRITLTSGLLRKSVEETLVANGGFLLAYLRPSVTDAVLQALDGVRREVRVYGAVDHARRQYYEGRGITFFPLSPAFVRDLASCDRVIQSSPSRNHDSTSSTSMLGMLSTTGWECNAVSTTYHRRPSTSSSDRDLGKILAYRMACTGSWT
jgi:hypothetical protein